MASKALPSQDVLRQLLDYDPETGALTWKARDVSLFKVGKQPVEQSAATWNTRYAGRPALSTIDPNGYYFGPVLDVQYRAHRVIWKWVTGEDPQFIDHINGLRRDNRIENLRSVTRSENNRNKATRTDSASGALGVVWHKGGKKWMVRVGTSYIGLFETFSEAATARQSAQIAMGYHPNHGRVA